MEVKLKANFIKKMEYCIAKAKESEEQEKLLPAYSG
jgi:hypothetical protein